MCPIAVSGRFCDRQDERGLGYGYRKEVLSHPMHGAESIEVNAWRVACSRKPDRMEVKFLLWFFTHFWKDGKTSAFVGRNTIINSTYGRVKCKEAARHFYFIFGGIKNQSSKSFFLSITLLVGIACFFALVSSFFFFFPSTCLFRQLPQTLAKVFSSVADLQSGSHLGSSSRLQPGCGFPNCCLFLVSNSGPHDSAVGAGTGLDHVMFWGHWEREGLGN